MERSQTHWKCYRETGGKEATVVAAVFYGLLGYAFKSGLDYEYMQAIAAVVLIVAAGWISVGVIAEGPLGPLWPRRRVRK